MPKTIVFSKLTVQRVLLDVVNRQMRVEYIISSDGDNYSLPGQDIFYYELPIGEDGKPVTPPANWHQLSTANFQTLADLVALIQSTLEAWVLV